MLRLTIRARLYCLVTLVLILMVAQGASNQRGMSAAEAGLKQVLMTNKALRNHIDGDMMHDALRADVLAAFLAQSETEWIAVNTDIAEHSAKFRELIAANQKLDAGPEVAAALGEVLQPLESTSAPPRTSCAWCAAIARVPRA